MYAWVVDQFGNFTVRLKLKEMSPPDAAGSEAVMRVKYIGLNFRDILSIAGKYQEKRQLPFIPGVEAVGQVVQAGPSCSLKEGDRIMTMNNGAFAEFMLAPARSTFVVPKDMPYESAAAFQMSYQTSFFALLHRANLKAGEFLLVHGAAGGVGTSAIQIGKAFGARIIAVASSDEKLEICRKCGADFLINYHKDDFVKKALEITDGRGADVIYDPIGGDVFERSFKCIAWEGRIIVIGFAGGRIPEIRSNLVLLKNISVVGLFWGNYRIHNLRLIRETQRTLYRMYAEGQIDPVIYQRFPFNELPRALKRMEDRRSYGKVVVAC